MTKDGEAFLVSESPMPPVAGAPLLSPSQRGRAEMASMQYSPANPNDSLNVKMKFHFFSFQISEKTGFKGFA